MNGDVSVSVRFDREPILYLIDNKDKHPRFQPYCAIVLPFKSWKERIYKGVEDE